MRKREIRAWVIAYKATQKCAKCPESHPACLDFHHRDPATKGTTITQLWRRGYSLERIKAEIAKCDVLCANCHRKLHWEIGRPAVERKFKNPRERRVVIA